MLTLKFILAVFVTIISITTAFSQNAKDSLFQSQPGKEILGRQNVSFSIIPYIVNKAKATPISGNYHFKTIYQEGFEAGANYHFNFNTNYSLIVGLHGGAAARNFKFFISKTDFNPNLKFDVDEYGVPNREWDFYISMPLWIEKRWMNKQNSFWDLICGANLRYYPIRYIIDELGFMYPDVNGNNVDVLEITNSIGNNLHPWINYNIGGGYSFLLRSNNFLQLNLLANFSNKKMVNGVYQINVTGKPQSTGAYSANLSYVGLSLSYIFTGANKRIRKIYESKMK